jgi:hypothetical protein
MFPEVSLFPLETFLRKQKLQSDSKLFVFAVANHERSAKSAT